MQNTKTMSVTTGWHGCLPHLHSLFLQLGLSLNLELMNLTALAGWLARLRFRYSCLHHHPHVEIKDAHHCTWLFTWVLWIKSSGLHGRHFPKLSRNPRTVVILFLYKHILSNNRAVNSLTTLLPHVTHTKPSTCKTVWQIYIMTLVFNSGVGVCLCVHNVQRCLWRPERASNPWSWSYKCLWVMSASDQTQVLCKSTKYS